MPEKQLHEELLGEMGGACKCCTFLAKQSPRERAEWEGEFALPVAEISHTAFVVALNRRGVRIEEASVRRHRRNHAVR